MNLVAFVYHDVLAETRERSGFPGADADWYKLPRAQFERQLDAILAAGARPFERLADATRGGDRPADGATVLTFDDGGASALTTADCLERRGIRGRFYVVTERLGTPGFLTPAQLRALAARGHVIGTHSASHPIPFDAQAPAAQAREWRDSRAALEDLLGRAVTTGSVPGGGYRRAIASIAREAGLTLLFNSEPESRTGTVDGCTVAGRYMVTRSTPELQLVALTAGDALVRTRRWLGWNARKLAKTCASPVYAPLRRYLLARRVQPSAD